MKKKQKFLRFLPINFTLIRIRDLGLGSHQSIPLFVPSFLLYFHFLHFFQLACLSLPENLKLVRGHALVTRGQRFVRSMSALRLLFGFRKEVPSHVIVDIRLLVLLLSKGFAAATVFLFLCLSLEGEKRSRSFDQNVRPTERDSSKRRKKVKDGNAW